MEFDNMQELAQRMGVKIIHQNMQGDLAGAYIDQIIFLNNKLDDTAKKCILAEEIGHHFTAKSNVLELITVEDYQNELAGCKWGYEVLLPASQIKAAVRVGINSIKDIAALYKVTPEYVKEALTYYIYSGQLAAKEKSLSRRWRAYWGTRIKPLDRFSIVNNSGIYKCRLQEICNLHCLF